MVSDREDFLSEALLVFRQCYTLLFKLSKEDLIGDDKDLFVPLASCCNTALGIDKLLANDTHTENEAFMLMRSLLEKQVNYLYLRVAPKSEQDKFFSYPYYRMYHSTRKKLKGPVGTLSLNLDPRTVKRLEESKSVRQALSLFSSTNPRMNWTDKKFNQRLHTVVQKTGLNEGILLLSSMLTYADASEVLHGSLYGNMFLTGIYTFGDFKDTSNPTPEELKRNVSMKLTLPLMLLSMVSLGIVRLLVNDHKLNNYSEEAKAMESEIIKILESTQANKPLS